MTITRRPLGRVCSAGLGNVTERGCAGGGGVACGVCAWTTESAQTKRMMLTQRRKSAKEKRVAILSTLLCRLRRLGQVIQNQTIRVSEILLHHTLNVCGCDRLQAFKVGIHSRRISQQHRSFTQRECLAV